MPFVTESQEPNTITSAIFYLLKQNTKLSPHSKGGGLDSTFEEGVKECWIYFKTTKESLKEFTSCNL